MNDDKELELIKARKLRELRKKLTEKPVENNPDRNLVISRLYDRGIEVLTLAENKYPNQIKSIIKEIADLLRNNSISGNISGGDLLWVLKRVGMPVDIKTSISISKDGKLMSLTDKLKYDSD